MTLTHLILSAVLLLLAVALVPLFGLASAWRDIADALPRASHALSQQAMAADRMADAARLQANAQAKQQQNTADLADQLLTAAKASGLIPDDMPDDDVPHLALTVNGTRGVWCADR